MSNIIDININGASRQKIRINGDDNKILELNTADLNVLKRARDSYPKLQDLAKIASELDTVTHDSDNYFEDAGASEFITKISEIDTEMKSIVDFIFDSNVSEICAGNASMCDIIDGHARFEIIIASLLPLYENRIETETANMRKVSESYTSKYTK